MNMNRHCRIIKCILSGVVCALLLPVSMQAQKNTAFIPGQVWNDTDGNPINAHGGGLLYHNGTYYWYGLDGLELFLFMGSAVVDTHSLLLNGFL